VLAVSYVSCVIPLCLVNFVNIASCYNACTVVQITCILWQAVVTEQAMSLQTASSAYFWSDVELIVMNCVWLLLCGSMLNILGASGMSCASSKSDKIK